MESCAFAAGARIFISKFLGESLRVFLQRVVVATRSVRPPLFTDLLECHSFLEQALGRASLDVFSRA